MDVSILLVDDEIELTDSLSRVLKRESYEVDIANDGDTALQLILDHRTTGQLYDLLILDWMMPNQSGLEICRQVRALGDSTPVLFLTAKDTVDDRVLGLDAGADDYLIKPFELRELLARVRALLRRRDSLSTNTPGNSQRLQVEDLDLDLENQVAYRSDRMISLSDKEAQLLAFLMQHPQQLLTHEEIYQHVWPSEQPASNVLAAHIRLLRRKIEGVRDVPLIHTIYGKGYRFGI